MTFEEAALQVRNQATKEEALRTAYEILTMKYRGYRLKTYTRFWEIFESNIDRLWAKSGFLHCTSMNHLLKEVLIESGKFTDEDFQGRWTTIWLISPHQYLQVRVEGDKWIDIDMWGKVYGIQFGSYAHGFQ